MTDPYAVLGVPPGASDAEVKRAFRRLAKRLHPDLNPGNRAVEQQFRELSAAYELLSDPVQRRRFDRGEIDAAGRERRSGFHASGARAHRQSADGFSIEEVLQEFWRRGRRGAAPHSGAQPVETAAQSLPLTFLEAARGGRRQVALPDGRAVEVMIPPGIESGQRLRLHDARAGDCYLEIAVEPHPVFSRHDRDIHVEVPVTLAEAMLGATITVPTIHGAVALKVPAGSNSGSLLRLRGKGIVAGGASGDQYVRLTVMLPDPPEPELARFVERWTQRHGYNVRGKLDTV
ncbi:MAG TPA: J domain-containing protein [Stellaceae bacterium]|nr:J domain-containing protein [Stellaceae bacterium]